MKKIILFCVLLAAIASCKEDQTFYSEQNSSYERAKETVAQLKSGSVFFDGKEFYFANSGTFDEYISKISIDVEFKKAIGEKYGKYLLVGQLSNEEFEKKWLFDNFPATHYFALNKKGRMTIDKSAMRFDRGVQYVVDISNVDILDNESELKSEYVTTSEYGFYSNEKRNQSSRINYFGWDHLNGQNQYEFDLLPPQGGRRKYVHEINAHRFLINNNTGVHKYVLILRLKFEYKGGNGKWRPATEPRHLTLGPNFSYDGYFHSNGVYQNFTNTMSITWPNVSGDWNIVLAEYDAVAYGDPHWNIEIRGTITSNLPTIYTEYPWNNTGYPLW